jgi:hypothetical protein
MPGTLIFWAEEISSLGRSEAHGVNWIGHLESLTAAKLFQALLDNVKGEKRPRLSLSYFKQPQTVKAETLFHKVQWLFDDPPLWQAV